MTSTTIISTLTTHLDDSILAKCYQQLINNELQFSKGFTIDKLHFYRTYTIRLRIAKELKRDKFSDSAIDYWEKALRKLEVCQEERIFVNFGNSAHDLYVLCWTTDQKSLISCIWFTSLSQF